jgi:hypothetical protein
MKNYLLLFSILFILTNCSTPEPKKVEKEEIIIGVVGPVPEELPIEPYYPECVPTNDSIIPFEFEDKLDKIKLVSYYKMKPGDYFDEYDIEGMAHMTRGYIQGKGFNFEMFLNSIDLDVDQHSRLLCILQSYDPSENNLHSADCYNPHHCIFFLDKKERILGYVELCFSCSNSSDDIPNFRIVCNDQLDEIQSFFANLDFDVNSRW